MLCRWCLILLLFIASGLYLRGSGYDARQWTREWSGRSGEAIHAELIAVWGETAFFVSGNQFGHYPLRFLAPTDRSLAIQFRDQFQHELRKHAKGSESFSIGPLLDLHSMEWGEAGISSGFKRLQSDPDFYILFFAARDCLQSAQFLTELDDWYRLWRERFDNFEVFLVGWTPSNRRGMSAPLESSQLAFPWVRSGAENQLRFLRMMRPSSTPALVVLDRQGRPLLHSYRRGVDLGPESVLKRFPSLLFWSNPDHPLTEPLLFISERRTYLERNSHLLSLPPQPYRVEWGALEGTELPVASLDVALRISATGRVIGLGLPETLDAADRSRWEEVLSRWLFYPAMEEGRFVERMIRFRVSAED